MSHLPASAVRALVLAAAALALTACGGGPVPAASPTADPPASSAGTPVPSPSSFTDATACATFGDLGVEQRLLDVYADDTASTALVDEYAGAPAFQGALRQTVALLRSSEGELEGDFLAAACEDQPAG